MSQALQANNLKLEESIARQVTERLMREMDVMEQEREQREEMRFRKLDEAIRGRQRGYQEAAAAKLPPYTPTKSIRGLSVCSADKKIILRMQGEGAQKAEGDRKSVLKK